MKIFIYILAAFAFLKLTQPSATVVYGGSGPAYSSPIWSQAQQAFGASNIYGTPGASVESAVYADPNAAQMSSTVDIFGGLTPAQVADVSMGGGFST